MERAFKKGCHVIYFDEYRRPHDAIVTNWFHGGPDGQTEAEAQRIHDERQATNSPERRSSFYRPSCNLVYVTTDKTKTDPYGDQIERNTSTSYGRQQGSTPFLGRCWAWPDEAEEAKALAAKSYDEAVAK